MFARQWPALSSWGAGLIHIAIAASSPPVWAVALGLLGLIELAWGTSALRAGQVRHAPRVLAASLGAVALSAAAGVAGVMPWLPLGSALVMLLIIAAAAAAGSRRQRHADASLAARPSQVAHRPMRALLGLLLGALLVSGLTTPALAMTNAGENAVPHGQFSHTGGHGGH